MMIFFFFQAEDGIRDYKVTGVQTCALPISCRRDHAPRPAPCRELVELVRASLRALPRRDDVVREHELGHQKERETRRTHPPLDLELCLRRETAGIGDRAQPARRLRVATEDVTRLELEHA